jgi:hypothetical protein
MKVFFLTVLITLKVFSCYAEITQVKNMEEVFKHLQCADSKTLVVFDVDMVLIQPSNPAFQMANMKRFSPICKRIMKEISSDKQMLFLSLMTTNYDPVLIDERTPKLIQQLAQKEVPTIALTSNITGPFGIIPSMEKWRIDGLKRLGIDFSQSAPCHAPLVFDKLASYRGNYSLYLNGVIFANGMVVSKGDVFLAFLKKSQFTPNKVVFIDDREENLKSLESALQTMNKSVEFLGLHFLGAQEYASKMISESEFESQWQGLALEVTKLD